MTDLPTRNHWNPCHVSWQEVSGLHRVGKKSPASCQGGGSKRLVCFNGFACHEKCMASILRNHTKWGTWRFEITMTFGHEIDFGATTGTIQERWSKWWLKNWCPCWGSIISERIRRIRGQPVFRDFFGCIFQQIAADSSHVSTTN